MKDRKESKSSDETISKLDVTYFMHFFHGKHECSLILFVA